VKSGSKLSRLYLSSQSVWTTGYINKLVCMTGAIIKIPLQIGNQYIINKQPNKVRYILLIISFISQWQFIYLSLTENANIFINPPLEPD
jgi:hypothetical protein